MVLRKLGRIVGLGRGAIDWMEGIEIELFEGLKSPEMRIERVPEIIIIIIGGRGSPNLFNKGAALAYYIEKGGRVPTSQLRN